MNSSNYNFVIFVSKEDLGYGQHLNMETWEKIFYFYRILAWCPSDFSGYKHKVDTEFSEDWSILNDNKLQFAFNATCM